MALEDLVACMAARADHMESTRAAVEWEEGRHLERGIMSKVSLV